MARRHVLIGGGPATIAAAEAIRGADPAAEITLVSAEQDGYYSRPGLAYLLAREVPERRLFPFTDADFAGLRATRISGRAARLDAAAHTVMLEDGRALAYDRLLLATGSTALPAKVPGAHLDGVVKLDDLADARDIARRCTRAKGAVVVGRRHHRSGDRRGPARLPRAGPLLHAPGPLLAQRPLRDRVGRGRGRPAPLRRARPPLHRARAHRRRAAASRRSRPAAGDDDPLRHRRRRRRRAPDASSSPGRPGSPATAGSSSTSTCARSAGDVFAAGDVAETIHPVSGRRTLEVLWHSAVSKGRVAGLNMATEPVHAYEEGVSLNITRLAGQKTTIIGTVGSGKDADLEGLSRGDSQTWSELGEATLVESQDGRRAHPAGAGRTRHRRRRGHGRPDALVPAPGADRGARRRRRRRPPVSTAPGADVAARSSRTSGRRWSARDA